MRSPLNRHLGKLVQKLVEARMFTGGEDGVLFDRHANTVS